MKHLSKVLGVLGLVAVFSFMSFALVGHGGLAGVAGVQIGHAQTVPTWSASDTDDVISPSFDSWKTTFKWYLIFIIPILIILYFVGKALGVFQGKRR